jgi:ABC-type spermidine/putrescine transport system permease subunit I
VGAVALWTVGVFAALYAGSLDPSVRVTSSTLSSIINGVATVLMTVFIDPHMSGMTDDVIEGKVSESQFRKAIVWLVGSRLAGTILAQILLVPSAVLIVYVARML